MRRIATTCVVLCSLAVTARAADVLSQLGITLDAAKQVAVDSVINSGIYNPGLPAAAFKLLPASARAEVATAGVAWLKTYTTSPDFKQQYAAIRESHKPAPPEFYGTPEDELKKADEEQKQQAEESKKALAALPAEQRAQIEEAMKAAQAMTAQMNTPEMRKTRLDAIVAGARRAHDAVPAGAGDLEARLSGERRAGDRQAAARVPRGERGRRLRRDADVAQREDGVRERGLRGEAGAVEDVLPRRKGSDHRRPRRRPGLAQGARRLS